MIKITVTSKDLGEGVRVKLEGEISGMRDELVPEVAQILLDFDRLGHDILTDAFDLMLDKLKEERKNR